MSAFTGEQLWASATRSSCHRREHVSLDITTGHMTRRAPSTATPKEGQSRRSKIDQCTLTVQFSRDQASRSAGPQRPKPGGSPSTMVIPRRTARSPRKRLRRNLQRSSTLEADEPAVMTKLKARTDKYNAEVVKQPQERSQKGDQ